MNTNWAVQLEGHRALLAGLGLDDQAIRDCSFTVDTADPVVRERLAAFFSSLGYADRSVHSVSVHLPLNGVVEADVTGVSFRTEGAVRGSVRHILTKDQWELLASELRRLTTQTRWEKPS